MVDARYKYTFDEYLEMLRGSGQRVKEKILADADQNKNIDCREFKELCAFAYPEFEC